VIGPPSVGRRLAVPDRRRTPAAFQNRRRGQWDGETPSLRRCCAISPRGRGRGDPGRSGV